MAVQEYMPSVIEYAQQRVLLTTQLAAAYGTSPKVISNNFNRNQAWFEEGFHYYTVEGENLRLFKENHEDLSETLIPSNANKLYLWTERGALLHAKSLQTDKAWAVYSRLVEYYFHTKESTQLATTQEPAPNSQIINELMAKITQQEEQIRVLTQRLDDTCQTLGANLMNWRSSTRDLISKIARKIGMMGAYRSVNAECYNQLCLRAGVSLERRLSNKRKRLIKAGATMEQVRNISMLDIIGEDRALIEIYLMVVKEMAIRNGIAVDDRFITPVPPLEISES